ncbi:MAG: glycosyltransferase family 39 protein [Proteobacteria bacterium]|nr:glycosyltransferase family 39 protein [Pseudomonadota bacterium]
MAPQDGPARVPVLPLLGKVFPLFAIGLSLVLLPAWSWMRWCDPFEDFGREIYIPWMLSHGKLLYQDISYYSGPLSPYVNALWFELAGPGMVHLAILDIAWVILFTGVLYFFTRRLSSRLAATLACLSFLYLSAFGTLSPAGNFNFVSPYSHEMTHGIYLTFLGLFILGRWGDTGRIRWFVAAGFVTGLVALTKIEVMAAGLSALFLGAILVRPENRPQSLVKAWGAFLAAAAAGPLAFIVFFTLKGMGPGQAFVHTFAPFFTTTPQAAGLPFYRMMMGLIPFYRNLLAILVSLAGYAVVLGGLLGAAFLSRKLPEKTARALAAGAGLLLALGWWSQWMPFPWQYFARSWQVLAAVAVLVALTRWWRGRRERGRASTNRALTVAFCVFALFLLAKVFFKIFHAYYGFGLAMPAALVVILALTDWIPRALPTRLGREEVFRTLAVGLVAGLVLCHVSILDMRFSRKTVLVGTPSEGLYTDERGAAVNKLLEILRENAKPEDSLAVFPEGELVNYLSGMENPTAYPVILPLVEIMFGKETILSAYQEHPPDWVVLMHRTTAVYGLPFFGQHYGQDLMLWALTRYEPVVQIGAQPFLDPDKFGILLLRKRSGGEQG